MKSHTLAKMLLEMSDVEVVVPFSYDDDESVEREMVSVEFRNDSVLLDYYSPDHHIETPAEYEKRSKFQEWMRSNKSLYTSAGIKDLAIPKGW